MNIIRHRHRFAPAVGRTPGGFDYPVATDESLASLPAAVGVSVGVIDTGLVLDTHGHPHPWLAEHVQFGPEDGDPLGEGGGDDEHGYLAAADGHGTFVTGLILHEAPTARVVMRGVLDKLDDASSSDDALGPDDDQAVADAVRALAADPGVAVINLSFGGGAFVDDTTSANLGRALAELDERIAVVAAAGNDSTDAPVWPAAFDGVIAVGALDPTRRRPPGATPPRAWFSNHGGWVDVYADGVELLGPFVNYAETGEDEFGLRPAQHFRGWARWSGTSFASAVVSGRIAQTAIERGISGAAAAQAVLAEAGRFDSSGAVWLRAST